MKRKTILKKSVLLSALAISAGALTSCIDPTEGGSNVVVDKGEDFADNGFIPGTYQGNFTDQNGASATINVVLTPSTITITCPADYTAMPNITTGHKLQASQEYAVTRDAAADATRLGKMTITPSNTVAPTAVVDMVKTENDAPGNFFWDKTQLDVVCAPNRDIGGNPQTWTNTQPA